MSAENEERSCREKRKSEGKEENSFVYSSISLLEQNYKQYIRYFQLAVTILDS